MINFTDTFLTAAADWLRDYQEEAEIFLAKQKANPLPEKRRKEIDLYLSRLYGRMDICLKIIRLYADIEN